MWYHAYFYHVQSNTAIIYQNYMELFPDSYKLAMFWRSGTSYTRDISQEASFFASEMIVWLAGFHLKCLALKSST